MSTLQCKAFIALSTLVPALLGAPLVLAVTFTVNSTLDQLDDMAMPGTCHTEAGTCTLRAAIIQANRVSGAGATIVVPPGVYLLTISATAADGEEDGDLNLTTPPTGQDPTIIIIGAGAGATIIDANQLDRAFHVHAGRTASISGVTIRNGYLSGPAVFGGGIFNQGSLTVSDTVITRNHAGSAGSCPATGGGIASTGGLTVVKSEISHNDAGCSGGGIYNEGALNVRDSTISDNSAQIGGGGIFDAGIGTLRTVHNSAIHDNTALAGGGILNGSVANNTSSLILINSTLSQNRAVRGGGIFNFGIANVYNTSIVFNGADMNRDGSGTGGGVFNEDGVGKAFNLRNTLVAGNYLGNDHTTIADCAGTLNVYGPNLFGKLLPCTIRRDVGGGSYDVISSLSSIGPLQANGGPTSTHALLPGSNAIDGGDPVQGCVDDNSIVLATDQRGAPRVAGTRCDIGAFEFGAVAPVPTAIAIEYRHAGFDHYFVTAKAVGLRARLHRAQALAGACERGQDGRHRYVKQIRDVRVGEALHGDQHQHFALLDGKAQKPRAQVRCRAAGVRALCRRSPLRPVRGVEQPEEPRHEVDLGWARARSPPDASERLLDQVVGPIPLPDEHAGVPAEPGQGRQEIRGEAVGVVHNLRNAVYPHARLHGSTDGRRQFVKTSREYRHGECVSSGRGPWT